MGDDSSTIGRVLKETYRIDAYLGEGGPSVVYKGTDLVLSVDVAIKELKTGPNHNTAAAERFLREARTQARLVHQNIVSIRAMMEDEDQHYIVMEFVEGQDLAHRLYKMPQRQMPLSEVVPIFVQVLDGLSYAHDQGVIHRDIKPSNILVTPELHVKLADFGIAWARHEARLTQPGILLGTLMYMSPEQLRGEAIDARSDLYSIGITLFEALAGQPPFGAHEDQVNSYEMMSRHLFQEPPRLRQFRPDLSEEVEALVMRSLAKDPNERFASCKEFARLLLSVFPTDQLHSSSSFAVLRQTPPVGSIRLPSSGALQPPPPVAAAVSGAQQTQDGTGAFQREALPTPAHVKSPLDHFVPTKGTPVSSSAQGTAAFSRDAGHALPQSPTSSSQPQVDPLRWTPPSGQEGNTSPIQREALDQALQAGAAPWDNTSVPHTPTGIPTPPNPEQSQGPQKTEPSRKLWPLLIFLLCLGLGLGALVWRKHALHGTVPTPRVSKKPTLPDAQPKRVIRPPYPGNIRGGEMVFIPGGETVQGHGERTDRVPKLRKRARALPKGTPFRRYQRRFINPAPRRQISLRGFWIDKYEVTAGVYQSCVKAGGCPPIYPKRYAKKSLSQTLPPTQPMSHVTWDKAKIFCLWAHKRLPTEAEWEHAARGNTESSYPWGSTPPTCTRAIHWGCFRGKRRRARRPQSYNKIRALGLSPFGVADMAGNLSEWVQDCYDPIAYSTGKTRNPMVDRLGCRRRIIRGGSFLDPGDSPAHQSFFRQPVLLTPRPGRRKAYRRRLRGIGFRCARSQRIIR